MNSEVKLKRGSETTTVLEHYVGSFLKDGWVRVNESDKDLQGNAEQINKENEDKQRELERLAAVGRLAEQEKHEQALARIELEKQEAEEARTKDIKEQQIRNFDDEKKRHETHILGNDDKDVIGDYIEKNFDKKLDKRGSLEVVQEKAMQIVEEFYEEQAKALRS